MIIRYFNVVRIAVFKSNAHSPPEVYGGIVTPSPAKSKADRTCFEKALGDIARTEVDEEGTGEQQK